MNRILLIIFVFIFQLNDVVCQQDTIPLNFIRHKYNHYRVKPYVFVDVIRQIGGGIEFLPDPKYGIDFRFGYIHPFNLWKKVGDRNDNFLAKGFSLSLTPKLYFNRKSPVYVGAWFSYDYFSYKKKWADHGISRDEDFKGLRELRDRVTYGITYGITLGITKHYGKFSCEYFGAIGASGYNSLITIYDQDFPYTGYVVLPRPITEYYSHYDVNGMLGVKFGLRTYPMSFPNKSYQKHLNTEFINMVAKYGKAFKHAYKINKMSRSDFNEFRRIKKGRLREINYLAKHESSFEEKTLIKKMESYLKELRELATELGVEIEKPKEDKK